MEFGSPGVSDSLYPGLALALGVGAQVVLSLVLPPIGDGQAMLPGGAHSDSDSTAGQVTTHTY